MNKLIKKVIICTATITCSLVSTSTISYANNNSSINPQTIHIEDKIITYKTNDNLKCSYDLDTGKFKIDGIGSVVITTTVTEIYDTSLTEEEYLELDKQKTIESFQNLKNSVSTYVYNATGIPSNAPCTPAATFKKNIGQIVGEVAEVLTQLSNITKLFSCPGIPYSGMFDAISKITGLTGNILSAASSKITSDWAYDLEKTNSTYTVGNTTQYGYRYCNKRIIMHPIIKGKQYSSTTYNYGKKGTWWVNQKPY